MSRDVWLEEGFGGLGMVVSVAFSMCLVCFLADSARSGVVLSGVSGLV